ncbi:phosphoinositide 3-kinase regulatory subunit 6 isoform X1 [Gasterosteus aculeatus]
MSLSTLQSGMYGTVQALLKEMSGQSAPQTGVMRWSLHRNLEDNPSCSVSLIRALITELDKLIQIHETRSYTHTIPALHTLSYVVMQSGVMIPTSVYQKLYECLMKLLMFPSPYSSVALSTLRGIKMEMTTPGSSYLRRVTAEQNLMNEHITLQEKVFVLADPAVFSAPLEAAVRTHLEESSFFTDTMEKNVVLHVLQTGLGTSCQSSTLAQALKALGEQTTKTYFQEVVQAVEESETQGAGGCADYLNRLQRIYKDILTASKEEQTELDQSSVFNTAMPYPEINFHLWRDKEDLWNLLANFAACCASKSNAFDEEQKDKRDSVRSVDGGIERELKESDLDDVAPAAPSNPAPTLTRRNAIKTTKAPQKLFFMRDKMDLHPESPNKDRRRHTARVVVLGDDRVLGRVTRAYHSIRERESKCHILTEKVNLRFYYIPVSDEELSLTPAEGPCQMESRLSLASLLGRVDPWYNSNINSLGAAISKLAGTQSVHKEPKKPSAFLLDTLCYYLRCGTRPLKLPLYSVKMTRSGCDVIKEMFVSHLEAVIPEFRPLIEKSSQKQGVRPRKTRAEVFGLVLSVSYTEIALSKRGVEKGNTPMTCGVVIASEPAAVTSGRGHLTVKFHSVNPENNKTIRTQEISIRATQSLTLSVCLDKDSRCTYGNIQRVEISPCLDPGCSIWSKSERELLFSNDVDKVLYLPVNTFSGVSP